EREYAYTPSAEIASRAGVCAGPADGRVPRCAKCARPRRKEAAVPDNGFIEQVRAWLAAQPRGATVRWNHDLARPAEDVHTGWVDVNAPELCETCSLNWLLTIRGPDPDEGPADGYETLEVPHDVAVRGQWDHESHWWVDGT